MGVRKVPYKLDQTSFSSEFGAYQMYDTWQTNIAISGTIPNLFYNQYQVAFTFPLDKARGRAFIQRPDTGLKAPFNAGVRLETFLPNYTIYQYASTETVQTSTSYTASGTLIMNLYIINQTGGTITLTTQTLNLFVELYIAPIA